METESDLSRASVQDDVPSASSSFGDWLIAQSRDRDLAKSERTRFRLLAATERLLRDHSPADISINQIVALARVSRPSLYTYFEDLRQIMNVLLRMFSQKKWYDEARTRLHTTLPEGIRAANLRYCQMYEQNAHMYSAMAQTIPISEELTQNGFELNARLARRTVARMRRDGRVFDEAESQRLEATVLMLIAMSEGALRLRYSLRQPTLEAALPSVEAIAEEMTRIWYKALDIPADPARYGY